MMAQIMAVSRDLYAIFRRCAGICFLFNEFICGLVMGIESYIFRSWCVAAGVALKSRPQL